MLHLFIQLNPYSNYKAKDFKKDIAYKSWTLDQSLKIILSQKGRAFLIGSTGPWNPREKVYLIDEYGERNGLVSNLVEMDGLDYIYGFGELEVLNHSVYGKLFIKAILDT